MSVIHTLLDARPPRRIDGVPWIQVRPEHSENEDGPWAADPILSLSPVDTDPNDPQKRNVTFASDIAEAFFRLVFLDANENESPPTDPAYDDGSGVDWRPTTADVATLLRARTQDMGTESDVFSDTTRPTKGQVQLLIGRAVTEIGARLGTDELPSDDLRAFARELASIRAAMGVELSYFPEQTNDNQSAYDHLETLFERGIKSLIDSLPDTASTSKGIYSLRTRSDVSGVFPTEGLLP